MKIICDIIASLLILCSFITPTYIEEQNFEFNAESYSYPVKESKLTKGDTKNYIYFETNEQEKVMSVLDGLVTEVGREFSLGNYIKVDGSDGNVIKLRRREKITIPIKMV